MALADNPAYNKGRFYYDQGDMRIEMSPVGYSHGQDNGVVYYILLLYATIENIRIKGVVNTSLKRNVSFLTPTWTNTYGSCYGNGQKEGIPTKRANGLPVNIGP